MPTSDRPAFSACSGLPVLILATLLAGPALAAEYAWRIEEVVDGDTVKVRIPGLPPELAGLSVRVRGVDTPETWRPRCKDERVAGQTATAFVQAALAEGRVVFRDPRWGKFGGRVIADVIVQGRSLAVMLIVAGHGRAYDGGRRRGWCGAVGF